MSIRAPRLAEALRCFCLAAFKLLRDDAEGGAEVPFAFEEHASGGRTPLYEYKPLVRAYAEARADRLFALPEAAVALEELRHEPAAAVYARAHAGRGSDERALFRTILLPLAAGVAELCGGFDWDDLAFARAYGELERSLFGDRRSYAAIAPLVGVSVGEALELSRGVRVRTAADGELAAHWPEAHRLLPPEFGRAPDRLCVLELERPLPRAETEPPDAPGELADAVTALRLATAGAIAAGPVVFERLDWRPYGIRPILPIAGTEPGGEPTRLDAARGALARDLLERIAVADEDPDLSEALDRWELSLFEDEPFRSEQLREALAALLGGGDGLWAAAVRAALLLGETGRKRADELAALRTLVRGERSSESAPDAVRRALVETVLHGDRHRLIASLDDSLLGLRPRPAGYYAALAS